MKKSEIPVEGMYILAFLILMSLAGTSMYYYMEGQSTARNYRMSAAKIIEESESLKLMIDQERQFVLETVIFFLGSQGGVANVADYNNYNTSLITGTDEACVQAMKAMSGGITPTIEVLSRCIQNPDAYINPESLGAWKCDDNIYSYSECSEYQDNGATISPSLCCKDEINNKICHEGCLLALGFDTTNCVGKTYCGALSCKENNLEIPESYQGVQYYYKIGEQSKGYSCESLLSFNPEISYASQDLWVGADSAEIISSLLELSNNYFFMPHPSFNEYLKRVYNLDLKLSFKLKFRGCNDRFCEFSWVPYGDSEQGFIAQGVGGIPMMTVSNEIISIQTLEIPILDMVEYSKSMIENKEVVNYFAKFLENQTYLERRATFNTLPEPNDWKKIFAPTLGMSETNTALKVETYGPNTYDDSYCGSTPYNNLNYDCLMQHASSKLYDSISEPIIIERKGEYDYALRPIFNFVKTSLGGSLKGIDSCTESICEYEIILDSGKYAVFFKGSGDASGNLSINGIKHEFEITFGQEDYEQLKIYDDEVGRCAYNKYVPEQTFDYYKSFGCCKISDYSKGQCESIVKSNDYCEKVNNRYGRSQIGSHCFLQENDKGGDINYDINLIQFPSGNHEIILEDLNGLIESIDFIRMDFDNTYDIVQRRINGIIMNFGGSYDYYDESVKNCVSPMSQSALGYNDLTLEEAWYSTLCLRSLGKSWTTIIENYTGVFEKFESLSDAEKAMIDDFIKKYKIEIEEVRAGGELQYYKVYYNKTVCADNDCSFQLKNNPQLLWISNLNQQLNTLSDNELIVERLREIQKSSSYLPLPVKWIFAYRDKVSFNQTNQEIMGDTDCNLTYDVSKKSAPDCGCINNCQERQLCVFNFTSIDANKMLTDLYNFTEIFVENTDYRNQGVVGR